MAKLIGGLKKYVPRSNVITETIRIAENYIKTHAGSKGKVVDSDVYFKAAKILRPFADDLKAANKIADYQNQALVLKNKKKEAENHKILFEYSVNEARQNITKEKYWDPGELIKSLGEMNLRALNDYDVDIYIEMMDRVLTDGETPDQSIIDYRDELNQNALMFSELANSYIEPSLETKSLGPVNAEAYGAFVKTNPNTGSIVDIEIKTTAGEPPSAFLKTNNRYGGIPIYLTYTGRGDDRKGKMGQIDFNYNKKNKLLELDYGVLGFLKKAGSLIGETIKYKAGLETKPKETIFQEVEEFPLGEIPFNFFDIPKESVIRDGSGSYYFYDKNNILWPSESSEHLKTYLSGIGRDSADVDNKAYLGHPDFIRQHLKADEEGHSRIINDEMFSGLINPTGGVSAPLTTQRVGETVAPSIERGKTIGIQRPSPEFVGGKYQPSKVLAKGEEIFKRTV